MSRSIFPQVPERVALTLCGHTHGGQVDLPFITEAYLNRPLGRRITSMAISSKTAAI